MRIDKQTRRRKKKKRVSNRFMDRSRLNLRLIHWSFMLFSYLGYASTIRAEARDSDSTQSFREEIDRRIGRVVILGTNDQDIASIRDNKMNDLFNIDEFEEKKSTHSVLEASTIPTMASTSRSTDLYEGLESTSGVQDVNSGTRRDSLRFPLGAYSDNTLLEEPGEMMKNNHQQQTGTNGFEINTNSQTFAGPGSSSAQNSRYYSSGTYKPSYSSNKINNNNINHNYHYLKPTHYSHLPVNHHSSSKYHYNNNHQLPPNHAPLFGNGYAQGFHLKPYSSSSHHHHHLHQHHQSLFNTNHNALGALSQPPSNTQHQHSNYNYLNANHLVSSYISASSALSASINSLQQQTSVGSQESPPLISSSASPSTTTTTTTTTSTIASTGAALPPLVGVDGNSIDVDGVDFALLPAKPPLSSLLNADTCGRQQVATTNGGPSREPRIVGGNSTYEGEFPWAVSIQRHGNHHCGGVIVARRWILTAAHCVRSQLVANLIVRTGGHTLQRSNAASQNNSPLAITSSGSFERDYSVDQIVMHDDFNRLDNFQATSSVSGPVSLTSTGGHGNVMKSSANTANNADIALLHLRREISFNDFAWPVCFPSRDAGNFSGHDAIVIGWGKLSEKSEEFSNELQKVKLTIIDNKLCQGWFRQAGRDMPIDERIICAGFKQGGRDACHGDSGGPLLSRMSNGQYVVVGVVSTGIGCARPLLPGLYSRVSSYIGWLERHILASAV